MADTSSKGTRGHGRVAFLARVEDFRKLIDAGHQLRAIYDDHKEQLGFGYPQFTKYVIRYIRKAKDDGHQRKDEGQNPKQSLPAASTSPAVVTGGASPTLPASGQSGSKRPPVFQHDPTSGNNHDDLM